MVGSIDHFVDQQIALWQEERRIRERKGVEGSVLRPTICISRQYGARGAAMGRLVAERLGYDLVVNAGTLGIEGAAAQTVGAFRLRFGATS